MKCKFIRKDNLVFSNIDCYIYNINGHIFSFSIADSSMWPEMVDTVEVWLNSDGIYMPYCVVHGKTIDDGVNNFIKEYMV